MTPERWRDVERLYHAALAARPEARAAVLAAACSGDDALRREVESLLAQAASSGILDRSPAGVLGVPGSIDPRPPFPSRLGVFELQELVGVGGMGEVYRARDTRLGRDVAVKILPRAFRDDRHRVARLEREARVLASLNHPNIAAIYGLEESADVTALVMELVEGDDLSSRVPAGLDQALAIARQIAEALEAAHDQGVVHRDLKPANIKVRPDGTVKVLDFGLATSQTAPSHAGGVDVARQTHPGALLGTPAYMSPEQARGDPASRHTDIWAFGVVLYELLTGIPPFVRPTMAETIASVLDEQPDYSRLPAATPPNVRTLIRRCLEKDRRRRLQHIGDARVELDEARSSSTPAAGGPTSGAPGADRGKRHAIRGPVLVAAAFIAGGLASALWVRQAPRASPVVRTIIAADTFISGTDRGFAFTPDGSALGYISSDARQMFLRPLHALEPVTLLTTAAYIKGMFPSPDGRWFGYIENNFVVKKVAATGGPPVPVLTMDGPSRGAAWGPDDTIVIATGASDTGLLRVPAGGGSVTVLTRPDHERGEADHVAPVWLPGGRALLFTVMPAQGGLDAAKVAVLDLASGAFRTVVDGGYGARYVEGGYLVYAAAGALWATRFDLQRLETRGTPREVLRPIAAGVLGAAAEFDVARTGTLAYSRGALSQNNRVPMWVDRKGHDTPLGAPPDNYLHPRLSPDGKRLAIVVNGDIFVWDPARPWSTASRVTFDPRIDWFPVWTRDSRRILFGSWRGGGFSNIYSHDLAAGTTERLTDSPDMQLPTAVTGDGATLVFHSFTRRLEALPLRAGSVPVTLVETPGEERNGEISPDGRWLAYEGESTSRPDELDVFVRSFSDVDRGPWQVTRGGGLYPAWARTGQELFYVAPDGTMMAVPVEASGTTWSAGTPTPLFRGRYDFRDGALGRNYEPAPDGRILVLKNQTSDGPPHVVLVQNWFTEVARLVP